LILAVIIIIIMGSSGYVYARSDDSEIEQGYITFTGTNRNSIKAQDMRQKSPVTEEELREYLQRFPDLLGIEGAMIKAQEEYNVNALMLLAIIRLESGNGRSRLATNQNNLGGITSPNRSVAVYRSFDSKEECVMFMARLLGEQYLTEGGRFFSGYTLVDINKRYSTTSDWSDKIADIILEICYRITNA
jgi:beta-N-acetylglucosaminidase